MDHADLYFKWALALISFLGLCLGWSIRGNIKIFMGMFREHKEDFKSTKRDLYLKVNTNTGKLDRLLGEHNRNHQNGRQTEAVEQ